MLRQTIPKNVNMPKFVGRLLLKYMQRFKQTLDCKSYRWLGATLRRIDQWMKEDKRNTFKLEHLRLLFNNTQISEEWGAQFRETMSAVIDRWGRDEVTRNNQVKEKLSYLVSLKVYGLRCRNKVASERMQCR